LPERITRALAARRKRWLKGTWQIRQSNIFILPNRFGLYAGFLVLASFAMGYKVQNNFILLAVIFLFLVFMLSLIASVRNLQGLEIEADVAPYYFAGERQYIRLVFRKKQPAFNLALHTDTETITLDMSSGATSLMVPVGNFERGVHPIASIKVQTLFPFGIARAWSWINPPGDLVVAPKPKEYAPARYPRGNPAMASASDKKRQQNNFADELGDLRDYQDSDPPARIDWKRYAATRETMVREHGLDTQGEVLLRQPQGSLEAALSYLSGGLRVAERMGAPARMMLQGGESQNADYAVYDTPTREQAYYALARAN
tara:strand:+ start:2302 stop:3246 length:945 start_codon:yes stop_codon:yes gene_type:complete